MDDPNGQLAGFLRSLGFAGDRAIADALEIAFCDVDARRMRPGERRDHLYRRTVDWFAHVLDRGDTDDDAILASGRVAFLATSAAWRWPDHFLADEALPAEMVAALRAAALQPVPMSMPAAMADQPLEPVSATAAFRRLLRLGAVAPHLQRSA